MKSDVEENAGQVCIRCGEANEPGISRCAGCGAPMDDFAASSPWEMGTATGKAYHAVDPVKKPIIFWGVLVYFVPTGVLMIWEIIIMIGGLVGTGLPTSHYGMTGLLGLVIPVLYSVLSIWVVSSVTRRYLKGKRT